MSTGTARKLFGHILRICVLGLLICLIFVTGLPPLSGPESAENSDYPLLYREEVAAASLTYGVPEDLIYAVIYAESSFNPLAVSVDDARGLMQMVESTFIEMTGPGHLNENLPFEALFIPEVSIRYGTYYLKYLYDLFDGDWTCAVAAYNGGLGRVRTWLKDPACVDSEGNLTYIPIEETRLYVARVERTRVMYRNLYFTPAENTEQGETA